MGQRKGMCTKIEKKLMMPMQWYKVGLQGNEHIYVQGNSVRATDYLEIVTVYSNDDEVFVAHFKEWDYCIAAEGPSAE